MCWGVGMVGITSGPRAEAWPNVSPTMPRHVSNVLTLAAQGIPFWVLSAIVMICHAEGRTNRAMSSTQIVYQLPGTRYWIRSYTT